MCLLSRQEIPVASSLLLLSLLPGPALSAPETMGGGISLSQTRVLFLSTDKAQLLTVKNTGEQRYLIQSRVQMASENTAAAPFIITPPLFTLQPDSRQLLRILPQGAVLPTDRESLFTLALLAIPAQDAKDTATAKVSMGLRFTLKFFYRPTGLGNGPPPCSLRVSQAPGGVSINNPTPYFQTFGQLTLNGTPVSLDIRSSMLAPYSTEFYPATGPVRQVQWQTLTDEGGLATLCHPIEPFPQEKS